MSRGKSVFGSQINWVHIMTCASCGPWPSHFLSLNLGFLIRKVKMVPLPSAGGGRRERVSR